MPQPASADTTRRVSTLQSGTLIILRLAVGWHVLYQGLTKLFAENWSAAGYLTQSNWIFGDLFRRMAADPDTLRVVDTLNIYGLVVIGLSLVLGVLPRIAAFCGALLFAIYYVVMSPIGPAGFEWSSENDFFIVSRTLVEMVALFLVAAFPAGASFRLDRLIFRLVLGPARQHAKSAAGAKSATEQQPSSLQRRELIQGLASLPLVGFMVPAVYRRAKNRQIQGMSGATISLVQTSLKDLKGELPSGHIGDLKISRLILGNNLIGGWSHARDLLYVSSLFKAYNNPRKVFETFELAERAGINTINLITKQFPLMKQYPGVRDGTLQTVCQVFLTPDDITTDIDCAIDNGVTTPYIQGNVADSLVRDGRVEVIGNAIEYIRKQGYLAGLGAHSIRVLIECEKAGIEPDYYMKTLHHDSYWSATPRDQRVEFSVVGPKAPDGRKYHDNIFDLFPEQTVEFMAKTDKPWIAFKVLAAGAIHPDDGFRYAFENGADFLCVGMFDFQLVEDINIAVDVLASLNNRSRRWLA